MARQRVGPARGLDQDVSPDHPSLDVDRSDFGQVDCDFIDTEPAPFAPDNRLVIYFDDGGEEKVAFGPTAGWETFSRHKRDNRQTVRIRHTALLTRLVRPKTKYATAPRT